MKSKAVIILALALLTVSSPLMPKVGACLNLYGTNVEGDSIPIEREPDMLIRSLTQGADRQLWENKRMELEGRLKSLDDYQTRTDYAACLIYLGQQDKAIPILLNVEQQQPGKYITAVNLGTAYELAGDNEKALHWITEGIKRNAQAHQGTEWLHVKILETKISIIKEPSWLTKHSVLGMDFGLGEKPQEPERLSRDHLRQEKSGDEIHQALHYQLHERLKFVKPPDAVVANLLFDYGNVAALSLTLEEAKYLYELALKYGPVNENLVHSRLNYAQDMIPASSSWLGLGPRRLRWIRFSTVIALSAALWLYVRRKRKGRQASQS